LAAPPVTYEPQRSEPLDAEAEEANPTPVADLIQNRAAVLAMLFLATGALGLPLLWMNKKFSNAQRVFWAIVVTIYTILLILAFCWIMMWSYRRIRGY
jgi:hypothetical protein